MTWARILSKGSVGQLERLFLQILLLAKAVGLKLARIYTDQRKVPKHSAITRRRTVRTAFSRSSNLA